MVGGRHPIRSSHAPLPTVPNFDIEGGCDPFFDVRLGDGKNKIFDYKTAMKGKVKHFFPKQKIVDLDLRPFDVRIKSDVKIVFYDQDKVREISGAGCGGRVGVRMALTGPILPLHTLSLPLRTQIGQDKMFHFWFHTAFIDNNYLLLHKDVLDRACKDKACKEFDAEFKVGGWRLAVVERWWPPGQGLAQRTHALPTFPHPCSWSSSWRRLKSAPANLLQARASTWSTTTTTTWRATTMPRASPR